MANSGFGTHVRAHAHLVAAAALGGVAGLVAGASTLRPTATWLVAWNVAAWVYLASAGWRMLHAAPGHLARVARAQAESASTVLAIVAVAALASLGAVIVEISAARQAGAGHAWPHVVAAVGTVAGAWLLVPTLFAMNYASLYHDDIPVGGLAFPHAGAGHEPDYGDFLYFAFTIAVASQTADVAITDRAMRRLVLVQSILSFVFNTTILAFAINLAAGLI